MKVVNSFSAKVIVDIANSKLIETTKEGVNEISIDKLVDKFSDSLTLNVKGVTVHQFKQILSILSSEEQEYNISLKQDDSVEELLFSEEDAE